MEKQIQNGMLIKYFKEKAFGRENGIRTAKLYGLVFGSVALQNDSDLMRFVRLKKLQAIKRSINKTSDIHIVSENKLGSIVYYAIKTREEAEAYQQRMDKIRVGINRSVLHAFSVVQYNQKQVNAVSIIQPVLIRKRKKTGGFLNE